MTLEEALTEIDRLTALIATYARQQAEIEALIDRWRVEREASERLAADLAMKVARLEAERPRALN